RCRLELPIPSLPACRPGSSSGPRGNWEWIQVLEKEQTMEKLETLREAIFEAYRNIAVTDPQYQRPELERRRSMLEGVDEILDGHPLTSFSAVQLSLLELLVAYWRECEVEAGAPGPDPLQ